MDRWGRIVKLIVVAGAEGDHVGRLPRLQQCGQHIDGQVEAAQHDPRGDTDAGGLPAWPAGGAYQLQAWRSNS